MKQNPGMKWTWIAAVAAVGLAVLATGTARAHCDTMNGPLIPEAKAALEAGDVTPILKWIQTDNESEVRAAFGKAVADRGQGTETKGQADQLFLETLVRLHREGEGAPYTGINDEAVPPIVALGDHALATGSADAMIQKMSHHMAQGVQEKFDRVLAAAENKDKSVELGREYVEAYVVFMHYIEGIHATLLSAGGHHHAAVEGAVKPQGAHQE